MSLQAIWLMEEIALLGENVVRYDSSGNNNHLYTTTGPESTAGLLGNAVTSESAQHLIGPANPYLGSTDSDFSIGLVFRNRPNGGLTQTIMGVQGVAVDGWYLISTANTLFFRNASNPSQQVTAPIVEGEFTFCTFGYSAASSDLWLSVNGGAKSRAAVTNFGSFSSLALLDWSLERGGNESTLDIEIAAVFNQELTTAETQQWYDSGSGPSPANFGYAAGAFPAKTKTIVYEGDSLTFGIGVVPGINDYPSQATERLGAEWQLFNEGVGGQTTAAMVADFASSTLTHYDDTQERNVLVILGGTNDLALGNTTPSQIWANLSSMISDAKVTGFEVAIGTVTAATAGSFPNPNFESDRQALNALIRAGTEADYILDYANDPQIGLEANAVVGEFFTDNVHFTARGNDRFATVLAAGIPAATPVPVQSFRIQDTDNNDLIGVRASITSDVIGSDVVAVAMSDVNGEVTLSLPSGTYYVWQDSRNYVFNNPFILVLDGSVSVSSSGLLAGPVVDHTSDIEALQTTIASLETKTQADARQTILAGLLDSMPVAVEAALLDEGDGQQLIDAIVMLINSNLDLPSLELAAIGNQVRSELAVELARIDVPVSSSRDNTAVLSAISDLNNFNPVTQQVTTSNPSTGGTGSAHTPADVAAAILGTSPENSPLLSQIEREDGPLDKAFKDGDSITVDVGGVTRTGTHTKAN